MPRALALVRPALLRPVLAAVLAPVLAAVLAPWLTFVLVFVLASILAPTAHAQPAPRATPEAAAPAGSPEARPCRIGSAPHQEATQALTALSAQIEALAPAADHRPASAALTALLAHPCLRLADLDLAEPPRFDSALALKHFWKESGAVWLQEYLEHAKPGTEGGRLVVLPAAPRPTLSKETQPGHALAPLLCSLADADCAARTRGWALRASDALARGDSLSTTDSDECERKARRERAPRRYTAWRACLDSKLLRTMALPLGGLDAPADGWLVIHGRRGHYDFCDEIRAYDLATGAAYLAQRCDGLIRLWTGEGGDPDAGRIKTQAGQVVRENLREAAWMMLIAPFAGEKAVRSARYLYVPGGIEARRSARQEPRRRIIVTSSDQTELAWSYVRKGEVVVTGTLTWPSNDNDAARTHAVHLLQVAEASLVAGCPRAVLPAGLISTARLGDRPEVSPVDASADALDRVALELEQALERLRTDPAARGCPPAAPRPGQAGRREEPAQPGP